jgi:hypothetical protein
VWNFRFPNAILHYLRVDHAAFSWVVEKAREYAVSTGKVRGKKPTLSAAEAWVNQIIQEDRDRTTAKEEE